VGNTIKNILVWVVGGAMLLAAFNALSDKQEDKQQIEYSQFIQQVNSGEVSNVNIEGSVVSGYLIKGERTDKTAFYTNAPLDDNLVKTLLDNKVRVKVTPEEKPSMLASLFYSLLPVLLLIGAWFYFMRMQSGGGGKGGAFSFGKSRARLLDKDSNKVTFADVAGCDEAKEEVQEIVDYLKAPNRYQSLGGVLDSVVHDHEIRFFPGLQLCPCGGEPVFHLGCVLCASAREAPDEFLPGGWCDKHELCLGKVSLHLACPLEINLQKHVPARSDPHSHLYAGGAVAAVH